jgi:hypothetical protein
MATKFRTKEQSVVRDWNKYYRIIAAVLGK